DLWRVAAAVLPADGPAAPQRRAAAADDAAALVQQLDRPPAELHLPDLRRLSDDSDRISPWAQQPAVAAPAAHGAVGQYAWRVRAGPGADRDHIRRRTPQIFSEDRG